MCLLVCVSTCFRGWREGEGEGWGEGGGVEIACAFFGGFLLGDSNVEKWGDH